MLRAEIRDVLLRDDEIAAHVALRRRVHDHARHLRASGASVTSAYREIGGDVQAVIAELRSEIAGRTGRATELAVQVDRWVLEVFWPQLPG